MLGSVGIYKKILSNLRECRNTFFGLAGDFENLADSSKLKEEQRRVWRGSVKILQIFSPCCCVISFACNVMNDAFSNAHENLKRFDFHFFPCQQNP